MLGALVKDRGFRGASYHIETEVLGFPQQDPIVHYIQSLRADLMRNYLDYFGFPAVTSLQSTPYMFTA